MATLTRAEFFSEVARYTAAETENASVMWIDLACGSPTCRDAEQFEDAQQFLLVVGKKGDGRAGYLMLERDRPEGAPFASVRIRADVLERLPAVRGQSDLTIQIAADLRSESRRDYETVDGRRLHIHVDSQGRLVGFSLIKRQKDSG